jgi:hypothetical protein
MARSSLPFREIDYRSVHIAVEGKLRGSLARSLGDTLEALYHDGYDQVVIDLRRCPSLDSVAGIGIERALEAGQTLFLVPGVGVSLDDFLPLELADRAGLRIFATPADALREVRSKEESGAVAV